MPTDPDAVLAHLTREDPRVPVSILPLFPELMLCAHIGVRSGSAPKVSGLTLFSFPAHPLLSEADRFGLYDRRKTQRERVKEGTQAPP